MKTERIEQLAEGIAPAIFTGNDGKVFAMSTEQLQVFARGVLNAAGKAVVDDINEGVLANDTACVLDTIKQLRDEQ